LPKVQLSQSELGVENCRASFIFAIRSQSVQLIVPKQIIGQGSEHIRLRQLNSYLIYDKFFVKYMRVRWLWISLRTRRG